MSTLLLVGARAHWLVVVLVLGTIFSPVGTGVRILFSEPGIGFRYMLPLLVHALFGVLLTNCL